MELNISGAEVKSGQRLLARLEPVLAGVVRSLRLDDMEGVCVARLGAGVLLGFMIDLAVYEDQGPTRDRGSHPGRVRPLLVLAFKLQEFLSPHLEHKLQVIQDPWDLCPPPDQFLETSWSLARCDCPGYTRDNHSPL